MSTIPLNKFRRLTHSHTAIGDVVIYTVPAGITGIILSITIANVSTSSSNATVSVSKSGGGTATLINEFPVPPNDALNPLTGKIVLEEGDSLVVNASSPNILETYLSILENANE